MKTLMLSFLLIAAAMQLKAQQSTKLQKSLPQQKIKLFSDSLTSRSRLKPDTVDYSVSPLRIDRNMSMAEINERLKKMPQQNLSTMPIARLQGRSKMPIIQTDKTGYTMPVLGKHTSGGVYYMKKDTTTVANP